MTVAQLTSPTTPKESAKTTRTGLALFVIIIGVLMSAIDTTIVVLALPEMERTLRVPLSDIIWVILSYLLVMTLLASQVGRLGDMFGRVRMYEAGFVVFIVGSALCALAVNEATIVIFRVIQGIGGALVAANSGAVIADTFPVERRGRAYGFTAAGFSTGAILGILLGGLIVTYTSWRWIFWINVPAGIVAVAVALKVLHDSGQRRRQRLDLIGMLVLGASLFAILWAMTRLATVALSGEVEISLAAGVIGIVLFGLVEWRRKAPMINLSIFRIPSMSASFLAAMFQGLANFAVLFLLIMYLQGVRDLTPLDASLLLVPGYLVSAFIGPFGGRLADRFGPIWPATVGLAVQIVALGIYTLLTPTSTLWLVGVAAVVNGIGSGSFFPANNSAVMKIAPGASYGVASGLLRTFSNIGMVFSFAVAILIAARSIPRALAFAIFVGGTALNHHLGEAFSNGLHAALYASMISMALAAVLSASRVLHRPRPVPATPSSTYNGAVFNGDVSTGPTASGVTGLPGSHPSPNGASHDGDHPVSREVVGSGQAPAEGPASVEEITARLDAAVARAEAVERELEVVRGQAERAARERAEALQEAETAWALVELLDRELARRRLV
jgi:EmrB/QacA subfamily drug resistance transporter